MSSPSTSDDSTSAVKSRVLGLAVLFIVAASGVTFFLVGDLSEPAAMDPDYLWRPWSFLNEHETVVGIVSAVVFVVTGAALVVARRGGRMQPPIFAQVVVLTLLAGWLGLGYRVVTAGVIGANIGGGGVLLLTPVFALAAVAVLLTLAIRASRRRTTSNRL